MGLFRNVIPSLPVFVSFKEFGHNSTPHLCISFFDWQATEFYVLLNHEIIHGPIKWQVLLVAFLFVQHPAKSSKAYIAFEVLKNSFDDFQVAWFKYRERTQVLLSYSLRISFSSVNFQKETPYQHQNNVININLYNK